MTSEVILYRPIAESELTCELFRAFNRRQVVTRCWRKVDGQWVIRDIPFIDDWGENEYAEVVDELRRTARTGGLVQGAFVNGELKGFASVEPEPIGPQNEYLDLTFLIVSADLRGQGTGRRLFTLATEWAKAHDAQKLYISGHSAVESQAFYRAMGCVEALHPNAAHVAKEPADCQLECAL